MNNTLSELKKNILATLAYFDIFNYPLTMDELFLYLPCKCNRYDFDFALSSLVIERFIYHFERFYTLKNEYFLVERRNRGNIKADELIMIAKRVGSLLVRFPYVRGVAISGSLSKNYADKNSDIDLFIITSANRLWIARTLMHCFKKLTFLVNRQHYFCMNYYIDEQDLQIHEKNIFTAIEIATLIPLQGDAIFEQFFAANSWTRNYLPNRFMRLTTARPLKRGWIKRITEMLFNNRMGDWLDDLFRKITAKRWLKKVQQKKLNDRGIIMGMDSGKHYAKPDPKNFQDKLIAQHHDLVSQLLDHCKSSMARF
jgi:hypothetical protein